MPLEIVAVGPGAPAALKARVFRLRHRIYVGEMALPFEAPDGMLHDAFDLHGTNFLVTDGPEDVGTIRVTCRAHGPLELDLQHRAWRDAIDRTGYAPGQVH